MRDIDCPKYNDCLNIAAQSNSKIDCDKCKRHYFAVELGRTGGKIGGPARAKAISKEERIRIARNAAITRWGRLLDCPFCHKNNLIIEEIDLDWWSISCQNEGCGILGPHGITKEEAIKKWNA